MAKRYEERHERLVYKPKRMFRIYFINFSNLKIQSIDNHLHYILIVSYFQLIFMNLQLIRKYIPPDANSVSSIFKVLEDFTNFDNLFSYNGHDSLLIFFGCLISLYISIQILTLAIVTYSALNFKYSISFSAKVWSFLIKVHASVFFFPINNLLARTMWEFKNDNLNSTAKEIIFYFTLIGYIFNALFAILPYNFLSNVLADENSLSSKWPYQDQMVLFQKLIISLIGRFLPEVSAKPWIIIVINFIISGKRHFWFMYLLPRYNFKALRLNLCLIKFLTTSATLSFTILLINQIPNFEINSSGFIIIQICISFIYSVFCDLFFYQTIQNLLFVPIEKLNPYRALHKILMLKHLRRSMKMMNLASNKIDSYYLYFATSKVSMGKVFGENNFSVETDLNQKLFRDQLKRNLLERLVSHHKSNDTIKIILAQFYTQKLRLHTLAIKTLSQITSKSFIIKNSIDLLKFGIQDRVLDQSQNVESELKLYDYIMGKARQEQLTQKIKEQLTIQKKFWFEYNQSKPDVLKIEKLAGEVHQKKVRVEKYWSRLEHKSSKSLRTLDLLYAQYQTLVNNSSLKGDEYLQKYNLFNERYQKGLDNKCSRSFILQNNNYFSVMLRTHQDYLGTIVNCSKSVKRLLGYETDFLKDSNIKVLMTPHIAASHHDFLSDYIKTGVSKFMDKLQTVFVKNQSGYLQKASLLASLHPFVHQEAYLTGFFRIIKDSYEYILITPNGEIDSFTEGIGLKLMLRNRKINICEICPGFDKANKAFNSFAFKKLHERLQNSESYNDYQKENLAETQQKTENNLNTIAESVYSNRLLLTPNRKVSKFQSLLPPQDLIETKEDEIICENYSSIGDKILFYPLSSAQPNKRFLYFCRVRLEVFRNSFLKLLEIHMGDDNDNDPEDLEEKFENNQTESKRYEIDQSEAKSSEFENVEEKEPSNVLLNCEIAQLGENAEIPLCSSENVTNKLNFGKHDVVMPANERKMSLKKKFASDEIIKTNIHHKIKNKKKEDNSQKFILKNPNFVNYSSSVSSKSDTRKRKQAYIDQSLKNKYYHFSAYAFLVYFLSSAALVFCFEISLSFSVRSSLQKIKDLTTTLDLANSANDAITHIDLEIRAAHAAESGYIDLKTLIFGIKETLNADIPLTVNILKETNYNLNIAMKSLDSNIQKMFSSDLNRIYEINSDLTPGDYREFEMFSAVNILIQKLLKIKEKYSKTRKYELEDLVYFLINSSNDVLERSVNTVSVLLTETQNSVCDTSNRINTVQLICFLVGIVEVSISLCFFNWVYRSHLDLLEKSLVIPPKIVHIIQRKLDKFYEYLESDEIKESHLEENNHLAEEGNMNISNQVKSNKIIKIPKKDSLILQYIIRVSLFCMVICIYFTAISIPFRDVVRKVDIIGKKIDKLAITQSALYEEAILTFILGQLGSNDTKALVRNRPPEQELEIILESMLNKVNEIFLAFKEGNEDIDPDFASILKDDACKFLNPVAKAACKGLSQESQTLGLLSLIAKFHTLAHQIYDDYKTSTKSISYLQRMSLNVYGGLGMQTYVLRETLLLMIGKVRIEFNEIWEETNSQAFLFFWINSIESFVCDYVIWIFVLSPFIGLVNRVKKILRLFPVNALFSNPTLKGLLRITSKTKDNTIKIDF